MNKKVITAAVASALAVPAAVNAQETTVQTYGRINNAIQYSDVSGSDTVWGLRNVVSRLGFKAKSDLGNGLSAIGRYEFWTYTNREGDYQELPNAGTKNKGGFQDTRLGYVGLSGSWGAVTVGNQWSAWYDTIGTLMSQSYSVGYFLYSSVMGGPFRTSNTIKYANSFGPVYAELDIRMSQNATGADAPGGSSSPDEEVLGRDSGENDAIDGVGFGIVWNVMDSLAVHAGFDNDQKLVDDTKRWGIGAKYSGGNFWGSLAYYEKDALVKDDMWHVAVGGSFGKTNAWIAYSQANLDNNGPNDGTPKQVTWNINHNMGGGFRVYWEANLYDDDDSGALGKDIDIHLFGMRYDFST